MMSEEIWYWNIMQVSLTLMCLYIIFGSLSSYVYKNVKEQYTIYFRHED